MKNQNHTVRFRVFLFPGSVPLHIIGHRIRIVCFDEISLDKLIFVPKKEKGSSIGWNKNRKTVWFMCACRVMGRSLCDLTVYFNCKWIFRYCVNDRHTFTLMLCRPIYTCSRTRTMHYYCQRGSTEFHTPHRHSNAITLHAHTYKRGRVPHMHISSVHYRHHPYMVRFIKKP